MLSLGEAVVIRLGGPSNVRNVGAASSSSPPRTTEELLADLQACRKNHAAIAVFVGGDPLMRRDFPILLKATQRLGLRAGIATSGRLLVYPQARKLLVDGGVLYVRVALHGATAATHDALVGVDGAFAQTMDAVRALLVELPSSALVDVACTVAASNLAELEALVDLVGALPRKAALSLRFVGAQFPLEEGLWPPAAELQVRLSAALDKASSLGSDVVAAWEGFPPCVLEEHAHLRDELLRFGVPVYGSADTIAAIPLEPTDSRVHAYPCQECLHEATCPGVSPLFLEREGEAGLLPSRAVRANSFNYEKTRPVPGFVPRAGDCQALRERPDLPPGRALFLIEEAGCTLYESSTGDFTDRELAVVKDTLEQVYIDDHERGTLNEFLQHVRRVRVHPECRSCADRPRCCGAFQIDPERAFEREERWLRKEISRLRGRVLDVGCGDQLYREDMARLIADGLIDYHGLDPDAAALDRIRASGMGGTLHHGTIEHFEAEPGYFDYVLGLRSLNHFQDMERAFEVICKVTRLQAQLVFCDSLVYGLLRTASQVAFADQNAPVGHEHYRNWSSQQVVEFLKRFPLRLDVHRPVSAQSSNQWILKFMRVAEVPARSAGPGDP